MEAPSATGIEILENKTDAIKHYFEPDSDCGTVFAGCNTNFVEVGDYNILLQNYIKWGIICDVLFNQFSRFIQI